MGGTPLQDRWPDGRHRIRFLKIPPAHIPRFHPDNRRKSNIQRFPEPHLKRTGQTRRGVRAKP